MTPVEHAAGFLVLPVLISDPASVKHLCIKRVNDGGWRTQLLAKSCDDDEGLKLQLCDSADELLQAAGRVIHDNRLAWHLQLLPETLHQGLTAASAAATGAAAWGCNSNSSDVRCVKLEIGLHAGLLQDGKWKASPAAALLFKLLLPYDADTGEAVKAALAGPPGAAAAASNRYTLLSCFRELPSVSTAPPPTPISIAQHQQQQQQSQSASMSCSSSSSSSSSTLADLPHEVMQLLLRKLTAADLAMLAQCCHGLRSATWEAVPALRLTLYPHQRNALSWMLHREVHGGQEVPHPSIVKFTTSSGVPFYVDQVSGALSPDPPAPIYDIRGGFFCDEPGLGKTVTALSLILKTQGIKPSPTPGSTVTWLNMPDGRPVGFYTTSQNPGGSVTHDAQGFSHGDQSGVPAKPLTAGIHSSSLRRNSNSVLGFSNVTSSRQGAWALAPSLRGGSSRRRQRAAATEAAAAATTAAAAASAGGDSSRKRQRCQSAAVDDVEQTVVLQQQQQRRRRSAPPAVSTVGGVTAVPDMQQETAAKAAAAVQQLATPSKQVVLKAESKAPDQRGSGAAAAAGAVPEQQQQQQLLVSPRRAAAVKAGSKIQQLYSMMDDDVMCNKQQQQQQQMEAAARHQNAATAVASAACNGNVTGINRGNNNSSRDKEIDSDLVSSSDYVMSDAGEDDDDDFDYSTRDDSARDKAARNCMRTTRNKQQQQQERRLSSSKDLQHQHSAHTHADKQQQQQQASCRVTDNQQHSQQAGVQVHIAAAAAATNSNGNAGHDDGKHNSSSSSSNWVMCDHCSKWRSLPVGYKFESSDPDAPWFCCLHPNPELASCLHPEEPHDGNSAAAAAAWNASDDDAGGSIRYESMPGFIPATAATARSNVPHSLHESNVAHFNAVLNSAPEVAESPWLQQLLLWLCDQKPEGLLERGVTVPRELVQNVPDYGRLFALMALQKRAAPPTPRSNSRRRSTTPRAAARGGSSSSSRGASPTAAAEDADYAPEDDTTATTATAARGRGGGGSSSSRRRASAVGGYVAAHHTWIQPAACMELRFDGAALRAALETKATAAPRMYMSPATLVIVPVTLIPHWQQQIRQHLLPKRLRVLVLGSATAVAAGTDGAGSSSSRRSSSSSAASGGGAAETVCPPAHELAWCYDVVITTIQRLSSDWSMRGDPRMAERMVLLKVHWLRVLIDEGHSLGASLGLTNKLAMAVQLTASRRWVMTGTPTPATAAGSGAAHLQPLLSFLHHQPFGSSKSAWDGAVAKPLEAAASGAGSTKSGTAGQYVVAEWGRKQLLQLLSRVMIRSCKADLALLPPCYKQVSLLDFAPDHAASYNALVEVIRRNLLLADWCDDAHNESLLNQRQSRWAKEMLGNIRLACCVAGAMNLVPKDADVLETLELLSGRHELPKPDKEQHAVPALVSTTTTAVAAATTTASDGTPSTPPGSGAAASTVDPNAAAEVVLSRRWFYTGPRHPLHHIEEGLRHGCHCQICGQHTLLPMVTPCLHMMCTDCTATSRTDCPKCGAAYSMQPTDEPSRYKTNPQPKWEVPLELIEWQPVYHQIGATGLSGGQWSANWRVTRSTKVLHLIRRLIEVGICTPQQQQQQQQQSVGSAHSPMQANAGSVLSNSNCNGISPASGTTHAVKAIVFSQFWMHIQLIAAELSARGVRHVLLKKDMPARDKQAAVTRFRAAQHPCCMVMDESGALGLDLSFVRHIFLMEPIADAALEQQVVSRAHRMGAVAPVRVEVLAMRHTAEEHLVALRHQAATGRLTTTEADAAATHAAAAVAGTTEPAATPELQSPTASAAVAGSAESPAQQQQQQQQKVAQAAAAAAAEQDEVGGATAAAAAVDISNITNFVAIGGGGNQMDSRALRNLVLLHLKKVTVADLAELPVHDEPSSAAAAAAGLGEDGVWLQGALPVGAGGLKPAVEAAHMQQAEAEAGSGACRSAGALWSDYALQINGSCSTLQQQQHSRSEPLDIGEDYDDDAALQQQQQHYMDHQDQQQQEQKVANGRVQQQHVPAVKKRVVFVEDTADPAANQSRATGDKQQQQQDALPSQKARFQNGCVERPRWPTTAVGAACVPHGMQNGVSNAAVAASSCGGGAEGAAPVAVAAVDGSGVASSGAEKRPVKRLRFADDA